MHLPLPNLVRTDSSTIDIPNINPDIARRNRANELLRDVQQITLQETSTNPEAARFMPQLNQGTLERQRQVMGMQERQRPPPYVGRRPILGQRILLDGSDLNNHTIRPPVVRHQIHLNEQMEPNLLRVIGPDRVSRVEDLEQERQNERRRVHQEELQQIQRAHLPPQRSQPVRIPLQARLDEAFAEAERQRELQEADTESAPSTSDEEPPPLAQSSPPNTIRRYHSSPPIWRGSGSPPSNFRRWTRHRSPSPTLPRYALSPPFQRQIVRRDIFEERRQAGGQAPTERAVPHHSMKFHKVRLPGANLTIVVPTNFIWTATYQQRIDNIFKHYDEYFSEKSYAWKCNGAVQKLQHFVNAREETYVRYYNFLDEYDGYEKPLVEILQTTSI